MAVFNTGNRALCPGHYYAEGGRRTWKENEKILNNSASFFFVIILNQCKCFLPCTSWQLIMSTLYKWEQYEEIDGGREREREVVADILDS